MVTDVVAIVCYFMVCVHGTDHCYVQKAETPQEEKAVYEFLSPYVGQFDMIRSCGTSAELSKKPDKWWERAK